MQSLTLGEIRRSIGRNLGIVIIGTATSTVDNASLRDSKNLLGGDDEHNEKEVMIYDANCTTGIVDGETSVVSDFDSSNHDATIDPAFSAAVVSGDEYEMWDTPWRIADINDAINQAISELTDYCLQVQVDTSLFTENSKYLYSIPSGFTHLSKVEYVKSVSELEVEDCED